MYFNSAGKFVGEGAGIKNVGSTLAIGQIVELLLLVLLRFSKEVWHQTCDVDRPLLLGSPLSSICLRRSRRIFDVVGNSRRRMHGFCFDFFFAAGFIHVDNTAPKDLRASAQSLLGVLVYGLGTCSHTRVRRINSNE